jgi:FkbM family methyltransferase
MDTEYTTSSISVRGSHPTTFRHFGTPSGLMVARAILAGRTYPVVPFVHDVSVVLDIGANLGAASIFFSRLYPDARIYALEPAASSFELLRRNTAERPNIVALRHGLSASTRTVTLHHSAHDSVEASTRPSSRSSSDGEPIELRSVVAFLEGQRVASIDILKLDVEGTEVEVLQALGHVVASIKVVYLEYHSERDRLWIDQTMVQTHVLWRASVQLVHRGEFCYLRRDLIPPDASNLTPELVQTGSDRS